MDGRHAEEALAVSRLEVADLNNVGGAFRDIDDANDWQQEPPAGHEREDNDANREGLGANFAHKDLGGRGVEPEEAACSSGGGKGEGSESFLALAKSNDSVG